ncbi:efflux RND transporter periplasmic adaptor subunit [Shewanella waksmanii]|uniref:efflux RND transporter periplasmic adaptor subunit n=1 Tax=Shewanella waksmanii TaxID=213783 RepID=UPI00373557EC
MKSMTFNIIVLVVICSSASGLFFIINATAVEQTGHVQHDHVPVVEVQNIGQQEHSVLIMGHGEVSPFESTQITSEVSGKVTFWNPALAPGGLVKRGDLLFSVEKDAYLTDVLRAKQSVASAKAQLIEEQARGNVAANVIQTHGNIKVSELYLRQPQLLQAQRALESAQAELHLAENRLEDCDVYAPFDALVMTRNIGQGQYINTGERVALIHSVEYAEIHVPVPGFDSEFLPDTFESVIAQVEHDHGFLRLSSDVRDLGFVDSRTRMRKVAIKVADPYGLTSGYPALRFGDYVKVSFPGKQLLDVYKVPSQSIVDEMIWLVNMDNKLENKQVSVQRSEPGYYIVSGTLGKRAPVVVNLPDYPIAGTLVNPLISSAP